MAQTPEEKAAAKAAKDAEKAAAKAAKNSSGVATVTFHGGTREFSKEIHGDDFADVAAEFAETHGGEVV